ncbi:MerC family mercury resistance protein [Flavobacterium sp. ALJ2]|uniref:MerC family mercury resistance protein n=1 Tax=Flavobacterium sp. ALJ2 TaxID=2786960 RepID=UPI00189CFC7E|nr:MerC family mercury resistance protein [Flavobacterium sp. ALJ2]MBF7092792.1 MerC family mercury resistance protein [Flavobacterium sp. ALJ2]
MNTKTTFNWDFLGISSATICLVHCLVFPILTILPLGITHNPIIDLLFASIGFFAVIKIVKKATLPVSSILVLSIALIFISIIIEIILDVHTYLIFIGGIGMIIGHYINYRSHKK